MRDLIVLALIAAGVYLGFRQCGCFPSGDGAPSAGAISVDLDGAESSSVADGTAGARSERDEPSPAAVAAQEIVTAELAALLEGRQAEDPDGLRKTAERSGKVGRLAAALLDARSGEAKTSWLGQSRVLALADLTAGNRTSLKSRVDSAARKALYLPEESVSQPVRGGDSLVRIQKRFQSEQGVVVSVGILRWLNGISGDLIHPGDELRAPSAPVTLRASKSGFWLRLQIGDGILAEFPIGIGKDDKTPAESFVLKRPLEHPPWKDPVSGNLYHYGDPQYAIGTRWIGFEPNGPHRGLGIHGTNEPDSIGTAASLGCIRLRNADVELLAELVAPGMAIEIQE